MSEGKRPGGLTALAVINFIIGAFNALGAMGMFVMIAVANGLIQVPEESRGDAQKAWQELSKPLLYVMTGSYVVLALLAIASGVGYLKQHRFWGRTLGNGYAVVSIASSLGLVFLSMGKDGGGFNLASLVMVIYPVLTLVLLNTTFKEDFVR